jgi:thiol-disulfide isomerase/thioredoxin
VHGSKALRTGGGLFVGLVVGLVAVLIAIGGAAGCTGQEPSPQPAELSSPFQPCPPAQRLPSAAPPSQSPLVSLPCFTGGGPVDLARLGRPAVINLWASWCAPCRTELPELQRFARAAGETVTVLGVVTGDSRSAAASLGAGLSVTFPMLFDDTSQLLRSLARMALPITLFVDAGGGLRHVHATGVLTRAALVDLTREHLGVVVS